MTARVVNKVVNTVLRSFENNTLFCENNQMVITLPFLVLISYIIIAFAMLPETEILVASVKKATNKSEFLFSVLIYGWR
jgi:hypothetical protein